MKSDADDKWMTDELWEKRRGGGGTFDQMGSGLLCEGSRCPEIRGHRNAPSRSTPEPSYCKPVTCALFLILKYGLKPFPHHITPCYCH